MLYRRRSSNAGVIRCRSSPYRDLAPSGLPESGLSRMTGRGRNEPVSAQRRASKSYVLGVCATAVIRALRTGSPMAGACRPCFERDNLDPLLKVSDEQYDSLLGGEQGNAGVARRSPGLT